MVLHCHRSDLSPDQSGACGAQPELVLLAGSEVLGRRLSGGKGQLVLLLRQTLFAIRGCSSVGRASALHAEGQRFESARLHHY